MVLLYHFWQYRAYFSVRYYPKFFVNCMNGVCPAILSPERRVKEIILCWILSRLSSPSSAASNWGLIGIFQFDLVAWIFGGQDAILSRIIYTLVGIAALWCISLFFRDNDLVDR